MLYQVENTLRPSVYQVEKGRFSFRLYQAQSGGASPTIPLSVNP